MSAALHHAVIDLGIVLVVAGFMACVALLTLALFHAFDHARLWLMARRQYLQNRELAERDAQSQPRGCLGRVFFWNNGV